MSDVSEYRAARREDKLAERQADREDRRAAAEEARKDADAARRRAAAERREAEDRKAKRRAARAAKVGKVTGWVTENPARAFVRLVQACSIIPAVISQVGALSDASVEVLLAALLATMLEGAAWALVAMGSAAEKAGKPSTTYRVGAWVAGAVAAAINLAHGLQTYPAHAWVAVVLALSSLVAVWLTDLQTHASHRPSRAERRRLAEEQAAAKAAEVAREAAIAAHRAARKQHQPQVYEVMERLISSAPYGRLSEDDAWRTAWEYVHGIAVPGLTADLLAERNAARVRVGEHAARPVLSPIDRGLAELLGPAGADGDGDGSTLTLPPVLPYDLSEVSDSVYLDTVPSALDAAWRAISEEPETLGGIEEYAPQSPSGKAPGAPSGKAPRKAAGTSAGNSDAERPLDPEDLAKVRDLAELMESAGRRMSTSDVKAILGGGRNSYLVRVRRAIEAERTAARKQTEGEQR
ncbi:hypothetical protein Kpho02_72970 [Kitasatospora phosalacinea]|uniref:DUF2637 domain-containing protein n=1 Tax=Kitasatospora phosalacinea TaxID=2065 RepID=A0A9W6QD75_9ACTN|nr:hypothetical protein [Kitasatospora phosalacinea]GLW75000.1 hypothetical protein Kpho02_72970 [Kitasatospora phosalacinea]